MRIKETVSFPNDYTPDVNTSQTLSEIEDCLLTVNAESHRSKVSEEVTKMGNMLISPISLNDEIEKNFYMRGWRAKRHNFTYTHGACGDGYREIDFMKRRVGVEVQLGKYAYMHWDVNKLKIMECLGYINKGVLVVPTKKLQKQMSSGCPCYEMIVWDLYTLGYNLSCNPPIIVYGVE
jgi:Restriction endonuclease BglII